MGTPTYQPIANITLGSSAAGVTFSGITQQYRDLRIAFVGTTTALANVLFVLNDDYQTVYSKVDMAGRSASSTPLSQTNTTGSGHLNWATATNSSMLTSGTIDIMDYSATDKHKTYLSRSSSQEGDGTYSGTEAIAGRYAMNTAITKVYVLPGSGSFASGTSIALYGVLA